MGSLIKETPYSEITATLEILDHLGVGREDLKRFRGAAPEVQSHMAHIFKTSDSCIEISSTSKQVWNSLTHLTTVSVGEINHFSSSEHFKEDMEGSVRIWLLSADFAKHFGGKIEAFSGATVLKIHELLRANFDADILTELGSQCNISLGWIFSLMAKQGMGEKGVLLTNGKANFGYVTDDKGTLRTVVARWYSSFGGWLVSTNPTSNERMWFQGNQVISR